MPLSKAVVEKKRYAIDEIPVEAVRYFSGKKITPGFDYRDVWREEHKQAFTIAKMMDEELLTMMKASLAEVIVQGTTLEQWKAGVVGKLQAAGWWGKGQVLDPVTGKYSIAQLGSPARLKLIYDTNLRTAHAAGLWERIERGKKVMPYVMYELGPSEVHRPEHVKWNGTILPVDHPWWKTHAPPNGYGCRCRVSPLSKYEVEKKGGQSPDPEETMIEWANKRTGERTLVPRGIDPGWDTKPWPRKTAAELENELRNKAVFDKDVLLKALENSDGVTARQQINNLVSVFGVESMDEAQGKPLGRYISFEEIKQTEEQKREKIRAAGYYQVGDGLIVIDKKDKQQAITDLRTGESAIGIKTFIHETIHSATGLKCTSLAYTEFLGLEEALVEIATLDIVYGTFGIDVPDRWRSYEKYRDELTGVYTDASIEAGADVGKREATRLLAATSIRMRKGTNRPGIATKEDYVRSIMKNLVVSGSIKDVDLFRSEFERRLSVTGKFTGKARNAMGDVDFKKLHEENKGDWSWLLDYYTPGDFESALAVYKELERLDILDFESTEQLFMCSGDPARLLKAVQS